MKHSTKKANAAEQARLDERHNMPCIACEMGKIDQPSRTEAHHVVRGSYRKHSGGHMATLPLCGWHHRGDVRGCQVRCNPPTIANATQVYGPSFELSKGAFVKRYGSERELLAKIDERLAERAAA